MKKEIDVPNFENELKSIGAIPMTDTDILETNKLSKSAFFKEKYRKGLKNLTKIEMQQFRKLHPEWHLKDILVAIIKDYNVELPPIILLEMTQFIISEWEYAEQQEMIYS